MLRQVGIFCLVTAILLLEITRVNGTTTCEHRSYEQFMLGVYAPACPVSLLKKALRDWRFAEVPLLLTLPIETNEDNHIREVRDVIFSMSYPTPLKSEIKLAAVSTDAIDNVLGLDDEVTKSGHFLLMVSGNGLLRGRTPLTHRYGGHQFGIWAGQLGDGRAHLLGEYVNRFGERWELQLKGSGLTPYSRDGDGRAVVRSSVREFLASEAMHFLGIPTTRAASLVVSDDPVWRDQFYDGNFKQERAAVIMRLAKSWFRFGSFEILASYDEQTLLKQLADFVIKHHFPHIAANDANKYLIFFADVVEQTARLIAMWQSVGFTHGVCNTDNFSILSVTIDYGPFRFLDAYEPKTVPNTSDDEKRYSYENQPQVGYYNLEKLRLAIMKLLPAHKQFMLKQILNGYEDLYRTYVRQFFRRKIGLPDEKELDGELIDTLLDIMNTTKSDFTMTFRHLADWNLDLRALEDSNSKLWTLTGLKSQEPFQKWVLHYKERLNSSHIQDSERRRLMREVNPRYVLRDWILEQIIQQVEKDDFSLLRQAVDIFKKPFTEQSQAEELGYADPPPAWAENIKVSCSS